MPIYQTPNKASKPAEGEIEEKDRDGGETKLRMKKEKQYSRVYSIHISCNKVDK